MFLRSAKAGQTTKSINKLLSTPFVNLSPASFSSLYGDTGLSCYYKFNESTGNIVNQSVSSQKMSNADLVTNGVTYDVEGVLGTAISFDGTDDFASASSSTVSDWNFLSTDGAKFTWCGWMKNLSWGTYARFSATGNGNAGDVISLFNIETDGRIGVGLGQSGNDLFFVTSTSTMTNDTDYHFLIVSYDDSAGNLIITIDGGTPEVFGSKNLTNTSNSETFLYLAQNSASQDWWNGNIDELSIWKNRVLTTEEGLALYNSGSGLAIY